MWNDPSLIALLLAAAFVAGALNAVAGGGSFHCIPKHADADGQQ